MPGFSTLRWRKAAVGLFGVLVVMAILGVLLVFVFPHGSTNPGEYEVRPFLTVLLFCMVTLFTLILIRLIGLRLREESR